MRLLRKTWVCLLGVTLCLAACIPVQVSPATGGASTVTVGPGNIMVLAGGELWEPASETAMIIVSKDALKSPTEQESPPTDVSAVTTTQILTTGIVTSTTGHSLERTQQVVLWTQLISTKTEIATVELVGILSPFTSTISYLHRVNFELSRPEVDVNLSEVKAAVSSYVRDRFMNLGDTDIQRLGEGTRYFELVADDFKSEVIDYENYWERLQVFMVFMDDEDSIIIMLIMDGWWAAGLGKPKREDYEDMQIKYSLELSNYAEELLQEVRLLLTGAGLLKSNASATEGRFRQVETDWAGEQWYPSHAQTDETGMTMVRKSPFKSMVLVMRGFGIGGIL